MTTAIKIERVTADNAVILDNAGEDVFDAPVKDEYLSRFLADKGHMMIVAVQNGLTVGKCTAIVHHRPDKPDELYIDEVDVTPTLRKQGIGKMLIARMLELADEYGCEECWLGTEKDNIPAKALYESHGAQSEEIVLYYLNY
ncbi:GNAT family N-acetyltransferase [Sphingorhabdus sp. Alg239-R122]|uniref:GNAT family N-acetyltransferase n=1 Tax=Sphingorhabdus sp. Alg239-R122 TaxID=2305989 RepID=UPI0013DBAEC4|nr:GNAT family N-acetyltransferase [Sphingorhabdus sp. Alg239-R122]